jgi:hypothetical protein
MTYLPPVNGGRINATIGGNTAGAGALVSSGTLTLAGGNNVTLSQNGNAITISGANAAAGSNTLGISNLGNSAGTSGVISGSALQLALAGGNNITLSQSINGSSATITVSAFNQSNQSVGLYGLGNTTQNSSTTLDARTLSFNGLGMVTVGYSNGSIQLSATQTNQTAGLYALGNTTQNSSTTRDARSLSFNGLGGITVGYSNGSIQLSGPQTAAQTNQTVGLYGLGNTTQNSSTTLDARTISFNGLGGATVGYSNGSVQISAPQTVAQTNQTVGLYALGNTTQNSSTTLDARTLSFNGLGAATMGYSNGSIQVSVPTQTNQSLGLYAVGNTTGQSSSSTFDARTLSFNGAGIASVGYSGGSVVVSVPAGGGGITNINLSAGTTSNNLSKVTFADGNGVSFGLNASTITASVAAQTNQTVGLYALGNTTQNSSTTLDARTLSFNGLGAATMGYSNGSIQVSAPVTSSLSATGGASISSNGSTISIGAPIVGTLSRFVYPSEYLPLNTSGAANNSISFNYISLDQDVSASQFRALFSVSANTHTSASTNTYGLTAEVAVYTRNASTITRASSGSQTWSGTYSTNNTGSVQGIREVTIPINMAMSPGEYWFGFRMSSSSSNASVGYSLFQVSNQITVHLVPARFGAASAASQLLYPWHGLYSVTSGTLPASATLNDVLGSGTQGSRAMYFFDLRNYTVL